MPFFADVNAATPIRLAAVLGAFEREDGSYRVLCLSAGRHAELTQITEPTPAGTAGADLGNLDT